MTTIVQQSQKKINKICKDAGIVYLALFGSRARGDQSKNSDFDMLVEFKESPGLISFIRTKQQLEKALGQKVDLITKKGLSSYLKPYIQKDLEQIYG